MFPSPLELFHKNLRVLKCYEEAEITLGDNLIQHLKKQEKQDKSNNNNNNNNTQNRFKKDDIGCPL